MKEFLIERLNHFERNDFMPGEHLKEAFIIFFGWTIPTSLFVIWANNFHPEVHFYQEAIGEGRGPNLWNTIGSFGLFAFGIAIIFSRFTTPSLVARQILLNTYAIGCLTLGLQIGQLCVLLSSHEWIWWQKGLFGITSSLLLVVLFTFNSVFWYLSFLIKNDDKNKSNFLVKLEQMHWIWKFVIGFFLMTLISSIFLSET